MEWLSIPACPSLVCSFDRGNIEGTSSLKICVWCLCIHVLFYVCLGIGFVHWLDKRLICIYIRRVLKCVFVYSRVWLSWGVKIQLLSNYWHSILSRGQGYHFMVKYWACNQKLAGLILGGGGGGGGTGALCVLVCSSPAALFSDCGVFLFPRCQTPWTSPPCSTRATWQSPSCTSRQTRLVGARSPSPSPKSPRPQPRHWARSTVWSRPPTTWPRSGPTALQTPSSKGEGASALLCCFSLGSHTVSVRCRQCLAVGLAGRLSFLRRKKKAPPPPPHTKTNKKCIEISYRPPLRCKDVVPSVVCSWLKPAVALESTSVPLFKIFLLNCCCCFYCVLTSFMSWTYYGRFFTFFFFKTKIFGEFFLSFLTFDWLILHSACDCGEKSCLNPRKSHLFLLLFLTVISCIQKGLMSSDQ